jgi:hypothetical protein
MTKAEAVFDFPFGDVRLPESLHSVLLTQLSRGSWQSFLSISKVANNPLVVYATVARKEMKIAEN